MRRRIMKQQIADAYLLAPMSRILLVDEDEDDLDYHARMLEGQGHYVVRSGSFDEGRSLVGAEEFDIAFVSQGGPAFAGRSLVEHLCASGVRIPVVVLTQHCDLRRYLEVMHLGAVDYLEKPVAPAELRRVLRSALQPVMANG